MKQKAFTLALLILISTATFVAMGSSFSPANGQSYGLNIYYLTQEGGFNQIQNATVGEAVTLLATQYTSNGTYNLYYNNKLVKTGSSEGYFISANFTVPEIPAGTYNFTLTDVSANQNTTLEFPILTQFLVTPIVPTAPSQLQEGSTVSLNVTVLGGTANTAYNAEILVMLPASLSTNFTRVVQLTTSDLGTAQTLVTYPDTSFSPSDSNTLYAGTYNVYFNQSLGLATSQFTVGFTDLTQYHRSDSVKVRAVGYSPGQTANLDITFNNNVIFIQSVTASDQGVITYTYTVPAQAAIGQYTVRISPQTSPSKAVADIQTFQVPGYPVTFHVANLAGEVVPGVIMSAYDSGSNQTYNGTSDYTGNAVVNLEKGSVNVKAYYNDVKVAETTSTVTGNGTNTITCQLADLTVRIQDKNGVVIPFVNLNVTFQYTTTGGASQSGTLQGQTDLNGVYSFNSTLTGITYKIQASKYDKAFNAGNDTVNNLPALPNVQVNVLCPDETLTLNVVDYYSATLANARVTLVEQASGIFYSVTTDGNGAAQATVTFGQYKVEIYTDSNILLNTTVVTVSSDTQTSIRCILYNLPVSVKIVDYFGTPITNVVVQLSRTGTTPVHATTSGDGTATFSNVIGGNVEITAYPSGNQAAYVATNLNVDSPTTVKLAMDKYVLFGGALVDTSTLTAVILIIVVIVLLIIVEVYRRTGFRLTRKASN